MQAYSDLLDIQVGQWWLGPVLRDNDRASVRKSSAHSRRLMAHLSHSRVSVVVEASARVEVPYQAITVGDIAATSHKRTVREEVKWNGLQTRDARNSGVGP
jgi:hypothetical protein